MERGGSQWKHNGKEVEMGLVIHLAHSISIWQVIWGGLNLSVNLSMMGRREQLVAWKERRRMD